MRSGGKETREGGGNKGSRLLEGQREGTRRRYGKMEGGGKCQMVGLKPSMTDGRLQKDGCKEERK